MKIIGLTGSIASGKSTVARLLEELGAEIVDADLIAREVVAPGSPLLDRISETFGTDVIDDSGALDRRRLGEIVFADAEARRKLEEIIHPAIRQVSARRIEDARRRGVAVVVYVAPLLIEAGRTGDVDEVWVVDVTEERQLQRLMSRDGCSREEGERRIAAQMRSSEKKRFAHRVIDNNGEPEQTARNVRRAFDDFVSAKT